MFPTLLRRLERWLRGGRQDHVDRRARADLARHQQLAARLLDETEHHRKSKARALAGSLGGVKRLGDFLDLALRDSTALIFDLSFERQRQPGRQARRGGTVDLAQGLHLSGQACVLRSRSCRQRARPNTPANNSTFINASNSAGPDLHPEHDKSK